MGTRKLCSSFPSTSWTDIASAARENGGEVRPALSRLLERYREPLRGYLVGRLGNMEAAEDLLHNFIKAKILDQNMLSKASRTKGRFRTYLLTSLERFAISEFRKDNACKRRPEGGFVPIDELPSKTASVAAANFDEIWARQILEKTREQMRQECQSKGWLLRWEVFEGRILKPIFEGSNPRPCKELLHQFGTNGTAPIHSELNKAKKMFARILRQVVAEYVPAPVVEDEVRQLRLDLTKSSGQAGMKGT